MGFQSTFASIGGAVAGSVLGVQAINKAKMDQANSALKKQQEARLAQRQEIMSRMYKVSTKYKDLKTGKFAKEADVNARVDQELNRGGK